MKSDNLPRSTWLSPVRQRTVRRVLLLAFCSLLVLAVARSAQARIFKVLHTFNGTNGSFPMGSLVMDSAGNLYGTTQEGGVYGYGVIYKVSATGQTTVLYNFTGGADGAYPNGVATDTAGNLYGTTYGDSNAGTIFKLDTSGKYTVLYSFTGEADGANPTAGVLWKAGALYGTTTYGGDYNCIESPDGYDSVGCGTVFKLDSNGTFTVLHTFIGGYGEGAFPEARLLRDAHGNLYGTAAGGFLPIGYDYGTVFRIDAAGNFRVLWNFLNVPDGSTPQASVVMGPARNLYGTTYVGGTGSDPYYCYGYGYGCGTVFKLDSSGRETVLYNFAGTESDGANPTGITIDPHGFLYGSTFSGGVVCNSSHHFGCGTLFAIGKNGRETVYLLGTHSPDRRGFNPLGKLLLDSAGNIYGTASAGGNLSANCQLTDGGCGTVFKITPLQGTGGDFYGTTF